MHDRQSIALLDVPVRLHVGVPDAERASPQMLLISVALELFDPPAFERDDRLSDTVDYDALITFLRDELPAHPPMRLIETVADVTSRRALALSPRIAFADVTVKKPGVLGGEGLVAVQLRRHADKATHRHAVFLAEESARAGAKL